MSNLLIKSYYNILESFSPFFFSISFFFFGDRGNGAVRRSRSGTGLSTSRPIRSSVPASASAQINGRLLSTETHAEVNFYSSLSSWSRRVQSRQSCTQFPFSNHKEELYCPWCVAVGWTQRWPSAYLSDQCSTLCAEPSLLAAKALWAHTHSEHTPTHSWYPCLPFSSLFFQNLTGDGNLRLLILPIVHLNILEVLSALIVAWVLPRDLSVMVDIFSCVSSCGDAVCAVQRAEQHGSVRHRAPKAVFSNAVCVDACGWKQPGTAESLQVHLSR